MLHYHHFKSLCKVHAFFILLRASLALPPSILHIVLLKSFEHPPRASIVILYCCTWYPGYRCFSSHLCSPHFRVFSSFFFSLFPVHEQLIANVMVMTYFILFLSSLILGLTLKKKKTVAHNTNRTQGPMQDTPLY